MTEYFNLSEWPRFHKMLNYRPNAAFEPKRSTVMQFYFEREATQ